MTYAIFGLGWFLYEKTPIMIMDDFGNAVVPNCAGWTSSLQDLSYV